MSDYTAARRGEGSDAAAVAAELAVLRLTLEPTYGVVNLSVVQRLDTGVGRGTEIRLDVLNVGDTVYQIRNGTGVGVGAPQFGLRRTVLAGLTQRF